MFPPSKLGSFLGIKREDRGRGFDPQVVADPRFRAASALTEGGRLELRAWLATPMYAAQAPLGPCSLWAIWPPLFLGSSSLLAWVGITATPEQFGSGVLSGG
jgi:hypothetical protein